MSAETSVAGIVIVGACQAGVSLRPSKTVGLYLSEDGQARYRNVRQR
jgi:hypothetical protein